MTAKIWPVERQNIEYQKCALPDETQKNRNFGVLRTTHRNDCCAEGNGCRKNVVVRPEREGHRRNNHKHYGYSKFLFLLILTAGIMYQARM